MFIVALVTLAKRWKQPKSSLTDEWVNLSDTVLSEMSQS